MRKNSKTNKLLNVKSNILQREHESEQPSQKILPNLLGMLGYTYLLDWSISLKLSFNLTIRGLVVLQVDKRSIKSSTTKHTHTHLSTMGHFNRQWNLQVLQQTVSCMDLQRHWHHYSDHLTDKKIYIKL